MMAPNPGFKAGIKQRTMLERIAWAWKGARQNLKERKLRPMDAIIEGRQLAESSAEKLTKKRAGGPKDILVALIFADNSGKYAGHVAFVPSDPHADSNDLIAARKHFKHIPIGFVVCALDRKKKALIVHGRPLLMHDAALRLLENWVERAGELDESGELKDWSVS